MRIIGLQKGISMIKDIFIAGAYTGVQKDNLNIYSELKEYLLSLNDNYNIVTLLDIDEFRNNYTLSHPNANLKEVDIAMVNFDLNFVKNCDLIIANLSTNSIGLGIELGSVINDNINILFVAQEGTTVSNMIIGGFKDYQIHYYKDFEDLKSIVENYINKVDKL